MPAESNYPPVDIPDVGLWDFLFTRKELPFPEDKSESIVIYVVR
jgi:4-coumarate--CoA ligase